MANTPCDIGQAADWIVQVLTGAGWRVLDQHKAKWTGSRYIRAVGPGGHRVTVRVADHGSSSFRCGRGDRGGWGWSIRVNRGWEYVCRSFGVCLRMVGVAWGKWLTVGRWDRVPSSVAGGFRKGAS